MPRLPGGQGSQLFGIGLFVPTTPIIYNLPFNQYSWPVSRLSVTYGGGWIQQGITVAPTIMPGQYDYPLPPAASAFRIDNLSWVVNPSIALETAVPAIPAAPNFWPRPLIWAFKQDTNWAVNPSPGLLVPPALIPPQFDYPLPPPLPGVGKTWTQLGPAYLAPVAVPFVQSSWPVPIQPTRVYAQSYSVSLSLTAMPFSQDDWPVPRRVPAFFYAQSQSIPYPILSFAATAFSQRAWPSPIQPYRVYAEVRRADIGLLHSVQPPTSQVDWPQVLQPPKVYAQSYSSPATITSITPIPFSLEDWPLPIQPYRVYAEARCADIGLLTSQQPPISQALWPPPVLPPRIYAQSYGMGAATLGVTPVPFSLTDWPDPVQPYRVYAEFRRADIGLLHSVQPFNQTSWPNPKLTFAGKTWIQGPVALQLQQPFSQDIWPAPIQPYRVYAEFRRADIGLLHSVQPPTNLSNWPIPTQPGRVYAQSSAIPGVALTPAAVPFSLEDWPAPTQPGRVYALARRADIGLLHSVKPPNSQTDWPNPRLPFQPTSARTWIQSVNRALSQSPPLRQPDWPNPWLGQTTKVRSTSYSSPISLLTAPQPKPFKQDLWPVPLLSAHLTLYFAATRRGYVQRSLFVAPTTITPEHFASDNQFYLPAFMTPVPEPTYDFPIGHSLKSDYGRRLQRGKLIMGTRRGRFIRSTPRR